MTQFEICKTFKWLRFSILSNIQVTMIYLKHANDPDDQLYNEDKECWKQTPRVQIQYNTSVTLISPLDSHYCGYQKRIRALLNPNPTVLVHVLLSWYVSSKMVNKITILPIIHSNMAANDGHSDISPQQCRMITRSKFISILLFLISDNLVFLL